MHHHLSIAAFTLFTAAACAQGLVRSDETFHYGALEAAAGGGCSSPGLVVGLQAGTANLHRDGAFDGSGFEWRVCPDGSGTNSGGTDTGAYTLWPDSRLEVRSASAPVTAPPIELQMRFDHGMLLQRRNPNGQPVLYTALRRAASAPSLGGTYYLVRIASRQGGAGLRGRTAAGLLTITGSTMSEFGLRHEVTASGTTDTTYSTTGTVAVAADGRLTVGPGAKPGAVAGDGEILFWLEPNGSEVAMTIAVRRGSGYGPGDLAGAWRIGALDVAAGGGAGLPRIGSRQGRMLVGGGGYGFVGTETIANSASAATSALTVSGGIAVGGDGLLNASESRRGQIGGLSASGRYLVLCDISTPGAASVTVGYRECVAPLPYGTATPGSGSIAPLLGNAGGAARLGNAAFALQVSRAVGGALGVFVVSGRPVPGVPGFGGTVWVDSGAGAVSATFFSSGAAGAPGVGTASLLLPIGSGTALLDLDFYAQALVLDLAAAAGVSMTPGLAFDICQ